MKQNASAQTHIRKSVRLHPRPAGAGRRARAHTHTQTKGSCDQMVKAQEWSETAVRDMYASVCVAVSA